MARTKLKREELQSKIDNLNKRSEPGFGIFVLFLDAPKLYLRINKYRRKLGWTWKRLMLVGFANTVARQGDNPDLVVEIADYLNELRR